MIPHGYAQATHLLANADLAVDLTRFKGRINVAVGADDTITPPAACERLAQAASTSLQVVPARGACRLYRSARRVYRDHRHVLRACKRRDNGAMNDARTPNAERDG